MHIRYSYITTYFVRSVIYSHEINSYSYCPGKNTITETIRFISFIVRSFVVNVKRNFFLASIALHTQILKIYEVLKIKYETSYEVRTNTNIRVLNKRKIILLGSEIIIKNLRDF